MAALSVPTEASSERKREYSRPGKRASQAGLQSTERSWFRRASKLRRSLRLNVEGSDINVRRQLRNHSGVDLIGQGVHAVAILVKGSDGDGHTDLQTARRRIKRADCSQRIDRAGATNLHLDCGRRNVDGVPRCLVNKRRRRTRKIGPHSNGRAAWLKRPSRSYACRCAPRIGRGVWSKSEIHRAAAIDRYRERLREGRVHRNGSRVRVYLRFSG